MNIFILDDDPRVAARYMCDKHVPKMIVESFQMLCTALHMTGNGTDDLYRPAYQHHPCTIWASESEDNWRWLYRHALELLNQYTIRFGKIHKCETTIYRKLMVMRLQGLPDKGLTPFAQAMPDHYKDRSAVWAYRAYYLGDKAYFAKWEKGVGAPWWWIENMTYTEPMEFRLASA